MNGLRLRSAAQMMTDARAFPAHEWAAEESDFDDRAIAHGQGGDRLRSSRQWEQQLIT